MNGFLLVLLGLWLLAAPATFDYPPTNDLLCGALLVFLGFLWRGKGVCFARLGALGIGIWLEAAPLFLWAQESAWYLNDTFVGVLVIGLSYIFTPMPGHPFENRHSIPPGWSYNPSSWPQRLPAAFFAFICWMISRYLAAFQLGYIPNPWDPFFEGGTLTVLTSDISKAFLVSDAGLGALAYTLELLSTVQGDVARWRTCPWMVVIFGILVIPVSLVSIILIILQPLAVHAWCTLCLITAVAMLIPIAFSIDEIAAVIHFLRLSKPKERWRLFFRGGPCPGALDDLRTPSLHAPLGEILKAASWGVTFPLNLIAAALLGSTLMIFPSLFPMPKALFDLDPILGALTIVIASIACGEIARKARHLLLLPAAILFLAALLKLSGIACIIHLATAAAIGLLSARKGTISESY